MYSHPRFGPRLIFINECSRFIGVSIFIRQQVWRSHIGGNCGLVAEKVRIQCIWFVRVRTKLESPWMSLNLKTKIQSLECPWICKEVLECPWILLALVFGYFLKLFDIQDGHFVELILHVHIWPHYKVTFWTIQRQILLISNASSSVFSPWIRWYMALNVLEKSLNLTLPDMYEPWFVRGGGHFTKSGGRIRLPT
jgi:hypothetical protein